MPTADRRPFVALAVRRFVSQDHPDRELVVVDDGADPIEDLLPPDPRIRYIRLDQRRTIGFKRNLACDAARGELIVHWDDDDWVTDWRIRYQAESLVARGADVCGLDRVHYHDPASGRSWQYVYPGGPRPWVAGNTLCYTRATWSRRPFADVNVGEDSRFLWSDGSRRIVALEDPGFIVAFVHARNADPKYVGHREFRPCSTDALRAHVGAEFEAYCAAAAAVAGGTSAGAGTR
jgi:glycosyltransferase involved in cell wall biosynthesis